MTVTAEPVDGTFTAEQTVSVSVAGSDIPSTVGFADVTGFNVTIAAGSVSGTGMFMLFPVNDSVVNVDETITVSGTVSPSTVTVTPATLTLTDDEVPTEAPQDAPGNVMVASGDGALDLSWWPVAGGHPVTRCSTG